MVLAVDDDPLMREIVSVQLCKDGYAVVSAEDGAAALDRLKADKIDLVIADLEMPRMDGYQMIRQLRTNPETADLPVLVVTGAQDATACVRAYQAGATSFITKPVNWALFSNEVSYVLRNARQEHELRVAKQQLESALQCKDHIMAVISHELRTPLHSVSGFAKLITDEVHGALGHPSYADYAREIEAAGKSLNNRVNDMLLLARLLGDDATIERDEFDVEEIFALVRGACHDAADSDDPTIEFTVEDHDATLTCHAQLLTTAIRHLVENACKFGGEETAVVVGARSTPDADICYVSDNGPGIPDCVRRQCAEPFRQADMNLNRDKEGLGLGLTIARTVAERHGGVLHMDTPSDGGSLIEIMLPKTSKTSATAEAA